MPRSTPVVLRGNSKAASLHLSFGATASLMLGLVETSDIHLGLATEQYSSPQQYHQPGCFIRRCGEGADRHAGESLAQAMQHFVFRSEKEAPHCEMQWASSTAMKGCIR